MTLIEALQNAIKDLGYNQVLMQKEMNQMRKEMNAIRSELTVCKREY